MCRIVRILDNVDRMGTILYALFAFNLWSCNANKIQLFLSVSCCYLLFSSCFFLSCKFAVLFIFFKGTQNEVKLGNDQYLLMFLCLIISLVNRLEVIPSRGHFFVDEIY